jgi:hypothetical protein
MAYSKKGMTIKKMMKRRQSCGLCGGFISHDSRMMEERWPLHETGDTGNAKEGKCGVGTPPLPHGVQLPSKTTGLCRDLINSVLVS